jgi:hypothetical protein
MPLNSALRHDCKTTRIGRLCSECSYAEMTIADLDIWRAPNILVKRHGRDAAIAAAQRADECLAAGDVEGQAICVEAILELLRATPSEDERIN